MALSVRGSKGIRTLISSHIWCRTYPFAFPIRAASSKSQQSSKNNTSSGPPKALSVVQNQNAVLKMWSELRPDEPIFEQLSFLNPAVIPNDPHGVLRRIDPVAKILDNSALVIERRLEMLNVFIGYEQANRYIIMNPKGEHVGYIAEVEGNIGTNLRRQFLSTHRPFKAHILDKEGNQVLMISRPLRIVSGRISVFNKDDEGKLIGQVGQIWSPLRRKYELFVSRDAAFRQFAAIDERILSWDFTVADSAGNLIGSVNRNLRGLGRELFTDTGVYVLRMDAASPGTTNIENSKIVKWPPEQKKLSIPRDVVERGQASLSPEFQRRLLETLPKPTSLPSALTPQAKKTFELLNRAPQSGAVGFYVPKQLGLTLDQRAVMLATAVSIDFDYFSRHSGPGIMPIWIPGLGSPDPGMAEPGSTVPATPGFSPEEGPQLFPDDGPESPFPSDDSAPPDEWKDWGNESGGGGEGHTGGVGGEGTGEAGEWLSWIWQGVKGFFRFLGSLLGGD